MPIKMTNQQRHRSERAAEWARLKSKDGRFTGHTRKERRDRLFHRGDWSDDGVSKRWYEIVGEGTN
jgi:hypothetical protein